DRCATITEIISTTPITWRRSRRPTFPLNGRTPRRILNHAGYLAGFVTLPGSRQQGDKANSITPRRPQPPSAPSVAALNSRRGRSGVEMALEAARLDQQIKDFAPLVDGTP